MCFNNGNNCSCIWLILIIILVLCCCGNQGDSCGCRESTCC